VALVAAVAAAAAAGFWALSRHRPVTPDNVNELPARPSERVEQPAA
jgi:PiT family inorganic phosphate transporter